MNPKAILVVLYASKSLYITYINWRYQIHFIPDSLDYIFSAWPLDILAQRILFQGGGGALWGFSFIPSPDLLGDPLDSRRTHFKLWQADMTQHPRHGGTPRPRWEPVVGVLSDALFLRSRFVVRSRKCVGGKHSNSCLLLKRRLDTLPCSRVSSIRPKQTSHPRTFSFLFSEPMQDTPQRSGSLQLGHLLRSSQDSARRRSSLFQDLIMLHDLLF